MDAPTLYLTRQVEFSAAHRLYREELSALENSRVFGPCANPHGHGHNYLLEVTVRGAADPQTGMVVHFQSLKAVLHELVLVPLDHRHLNHDVAFLDGTLPTSENLVVALWDRLEPALRAQALSLYKVKLASSARNWVEYFGRQP